ncbi:MAG: nuclear transport factor 2 family protein [Alphaproteobacteria bacterium]|jgi:ketosteroid isomerase-like protein|nr:nuclear transport factor 2 family protein [Alphaproteobacteria bacterium]|tara:strand:- start:506 stop:895 length:390 start_codon:yes stop_codon:yes gene_type:complete
MPGLDRDKAQYLAAFSKAFNGNDVEATAKLVTDDFVWLFYEGPHSPEARILRGAAEGCAAVVERSRQLKVPIRFIEGEQYQCGDRIFTTYRAQGAFHATGPFDVRAVDIYTFRGGKLASKDTYWKKITP